MPGGPAPFGFAYFAAAKFIGYTAFCRWVIEPRITASLPGSDYSSTHFADAIAFSEPRSAFQAGAARTAIGIIAGTASGLLLFSGFLDHLHSERLAFAIFFALLIPIRIFEWRLLLWWMYREFPLASRSRAIVISFGIVTSFALDAVGFFAAFAIPGGAWIC